MSSIDYTLTLELGSLYLSSGTRRRRPSSTTKAQRSSACSTLHSTTSSRPKRPRSTSTRRHFGGRLTRSTSGCTTPSTVRPVLYVFANLTKSLSPDGVYKAGFAKTQEPYEDAVTKLFASLDRLEKVLEGKDYLVGGVLTEADVRLFATIVCHVFRLVLLQGDVECSSRFASTPSTIALSSVTSAQSEEAIPRFICKTTPCILCL